MPEIRRHLVPSSSVFCDAGGVNAGMSRFTAGEADYGRLGASL